MEKKKKDGKIFTPKEIVLEMLDNTLGWSNLKFECGRVYWPNARKHIIDNSCGDGAFLVAIVDFYCHNVEVTTRRNKTELKNMLETYIHGIELDPVEYQKCLANLDEMARLNGLKDVKWDIQNRDALSCHDYDGKMDFVIANPPYIRTHDLECDLSGFTFTDEGMKDIYLAFYELGFRMLNETGKMCYITPSSWFTSLAGQKMRDYIIENRNLEYVEDYGHYQLFENATTYVAITRFGKDKTDIVKHVRVERTQDDDGFWECVTDIPFDDMNIDGKFYFGTPGQLMQMREIIEYGKNMKRQDKVFQVKNGYATLADDVFIPKDMQGAHRVYHSVRPWNIIPVIKSSTGKQEWCYYPYDKNGKLMEEKYVDEIILETLRKSKDKLESRATTEPWYAFGRTQAINDTWKDKWTIKNIVKTPDDLKPVEAPAGTGVYGGLYILTEHPEGLKALETQDFMNYVRMLGKYKSGGYYTYSSKELENYLNYRYGKETD
jgi:adenine-specific DNA-methyltransferase